MEVKNSSHFGYKTHTERRCNSCGLTTFCLRTLYKHKYKCRGLLLGIPLKCGYCKRKYKFSFLLKHHQKTCVKRDKRKKIFLSKVKKQRKPTTNELNFKKNFNNKPSTIVCPICMQFFKSRALYIKHEQSGVCQSPIKVKGPSFSARKSLPNTPSIIKNKRKYFIQTSDSDSFTSDNLLSEIIDRKRQSYKSLTRGYMCIHCKNIFPAKIVLLKHLELKYRCALAHYEQSSYYKPTHKARKTVQHSFARKSFSYGITKSYKYDTFTGIKGSARKSLPNSFRDRPVKAYSFETSINKKLNQCPVCNKEFSDSLNFHQHQKKFNHWGKATKSVNLNCKCPFCQKEFFNVRARNMHVKNHSDRTDENIETFIRSTTCDICSEIFVSETVKLQHMRIEHSKPNNGVLNNTFSSENKSTKSISLPPIIKQQLKEHPLACPVCAKEFVSTALRNKHFEEIHLDSDLECRFCPIKCSNSEVLDKHMQELHVDEFKHSCSVCKEKFPTISHVILHIKKYHFDNNTKKTQENTKPLNQSVSNSTNGGKIENQELQNKPPGYFCDICNLNFQKLQFLRRHEQSKQHRDTLFKSLDAVHETLSNLPPSPPPTLPKPIEIPKVLSCSECFEEFTILKDFIPHRLSHFSKQEKYMEITEENKYTCEICGDVSDSHSKVQLHLFWHLQVESSSKDKNSADIVKNKIKANVKSGNQHVAKKSFGKQSRDTHQEVVIGGIKKHLFTCEACHISFTNQDHYNMHVRRFCKMKNNSSPKTVIKDHSQSSSNSDNDKIKINKENEQIVNLKETIQNENLKDNKQIQDLKNDKRIENLKNDKQIENLKDNKQIENSKDNKQIENSKENIQSENLSETKQIEVKEEISVSLSKAEDIQIEHCNICHCLFNTSVKETHNNFCLNYKQANLDLSCDIDSLMKPLKENEKIAACLACNCTFDATESFLQHMNTVHCVNESDTTPISNDVEIPVEEEGNIIHCIICNFIFFSSEVLEDHERVCHEFSYSNSKLENFTPELKAVLEENCIIASCLACDLAFNNNEDVAQHIASHQAASTATAEQKTSEIEFDNSLNTLGEEKMDTGEAVVFQEEQIQPGPVPCDIVSDSNNYVVGEKNSLNVSSVLPSEKITSVMDHKDSSTLSSDAPSNSLQKEEFDSVIDNLRKNFSQLLSILVSDPDLMQQLGYGELTVDEVLINVLQTMEQTPVVKDEHTSDLECLRKNIQILLDFCLEDQVMNLIGDGKTSTDDIVVEALKIFGGESSVSIVSVE